MANLVTHAPTITGLRLDDKFVAAAGGGDTCETGKNVKLLVRNGGATTPTVTIATPETVDGDLAVADRVVTIPANATLFAIPVTDRYRNPSTGRANITYSSPTDLTVCCVRG